MAGEVLGRSSAAPRRWKGHVHSAAPSPPRMVVTVGDEEILRFLLRYKYARNEQVAAWLDRSPQRTSRRLALLSQHRLVTSRWVAFSGSVPGGGVRETLTKVWSTSSRGAAIVGAMEIPRPGSEPTARVLGPKRWSPQLADHTLGVADLAVRYQRAGMAVVSEREIRKVEGSTSGGQLLYSARMLNGARKLRVPDLAVLDAGERLWAVELERRLANGDDYRDVLSAYLAAGHVTGVIWQCPRRSTAERIAAQSERLGLPLQPAGPGAWESLDGRVRLERFVPPSARQATTRAELSSSWTGGA